MEYEGEDGANWLIEVVGVKVGVGSENEASERSMLLLTGEANEVSDMAGGGRMKEGGSIMFGVVQAA